MKPPTDFIKSTEVKTGNNISPLILITTKRGKTFKFCVSFCDKSVDLKSTSVDLKSIIKCLKDKNITITTIDFENLEKTHKIYCREFKKTKPFIY